MVTGAAIEMVHLVHTHMVVNGVSVMGVTHHIGPRWQHSREVGVRWWSMMVHAWPTTTEHWWAVVVWWREAATRRLLVRVMVVVMHSSSEWWSRQVLRMLHVILE